MKLAMLVSLSSSPLDALDRLSLYHNQLNLVDQIDQVTLLKFPNICTPNQTRKLTQIHRNHSKKGSWFYFFCFRLDFTTACVLVELPPANKFVIYMTSTEVIGNLGCKHMDLSLHMYGKIWGEKLPLRTQQKSLSWYEIMERRDKDQPDFTFSGESFLSITCTLIG